MVSCRGEEYVDAAKSRNYYYSKDKTTILFDSAIRVMNLVAKSDYIVVPANVDSFKVISSKFAKDDRFIFYIATPLSNVDYYSFYWDDLAKVPKDKNHVYYPNTYTNKLTVVEDADPETYEKLDLGIRCLDWYKDKNHYFYNHKKVDADKASMNFTSPLLPFDSTYVFLVDSGVVCQQKHQGNVKALSKNVLCDDSTLYFKASCDSLTQCIKTPNIGSFLYYNRKYHIFRLDDRVFYMGELLQGADANTFDLISFPYSKDKDDVFYKNTVLPNSDPRTFKILSSKYAKDKNNVYEEGQIIKGYSPDEFRPDAWGRYPVDPNYGRKPVNIKDN